MDTHKIRLAGDPYETVQWLAEHGNHRGVITAPFLGLLFDRGPGTPVQLALPGDTLVAHDDGTVTVE